MSSISKLSNSYEDNEAVALMPVPRDAEKYKMNHTNRGIAVILWHENFQNNLFKRLGAYVDVEHLTKILMKLGFSVEFHKDLTVSEIMDVLNRVSKKDHSDNDCFLLVCMTFGNQSVLHAFDSLYDLRILTRDFTADNCPSLAGKPKLFWIQASPLNQDGTDILRRVQFDSAASYKIPVQADFLISYSCIPDFLHSDGKTRSSWFIQALSGMLEKYSSSEDMLLLCTQVNYKVVANMKSYNTYNPDNQIKIQAPCNSSMLIRKLQFPENIQMSNIGMKENTEDSTQERFYNMNHKKRGITMIFSHTHFQTSRKPRKGNARDVSLAENTFTKLGFEVIVHHDLTYDEINASLKKVSERDHSEYDCFVLVCLTHGTETTIEASDNPYNPNRLWINFTDEKCPGLIGKPRMFFLQLCRGNQFDSGVKLHFSLQAQAHSGKQVNCGVLVNSQEKFEPYNLPTDPDFLIAFATTPGYVSWRHPLKGSNFIKALCETLNKYVYTEDMLSLLTRVNWKVAVDFESYNKADPDKHGRKQMPCITSMLTHKFKFTRKRN